MVYESFIEKTIIELLKIKGYEFIEENNFWVLER